MAVIKITLDRILDTNKASVTLIGPEGETARHEFPLLWLNDKDWQAIFWALKSQAQTPETYPKNPDIVSRAEILGLFSNGYPVSRRLRVIGYRLYEAVFGSEEIKSLFHHLLLRADEDVSIVQLSLPKEESILQAYPWELLHDGEDFLFDSHRAVLARYVEAEYAIDPIELKEVLEILLIDLRPRIPAKYPIQPLLARSYLKKLSERTLGKFVVQSLPDISVAKSTLHSLAEYLKRPSKNTHILHFDTHGDFGWLCQSCGTVNAPTSFKCQNQACEFRRPESIIIQGYLAYLTFQENESRLTWVSGQDLGKLLSNKGIQLVLLSGYEAGLESGFSAFNSVANALIKEGIPAVVTLQLPLDEIATEVFIEDFYTTLMQGKPITEAIAEARTSLLSISDDTWYRPILYLQSGPNNDRGQIFVGKLSKKEFFASFFDEIPSISYLEIESLYGAMRPDSKFYIERTVDDTCKKFLSNPNTATLFIQGPRQTGKSSLMHKMLDWAKKEGSICETRV